MTLKFSPKAHRYWLDGKPAPSVTALLKGYPKPALVYWAAKTVAEFVADNDAQVETLRGMGRGPMVAALKDVPWQSRDEKAAKGTEVHTLGERIVHGEQIDVPDYLTGYLDGYVQWLDSFAVQPVLTERSVGNREHWYCGRFDLIADIAGTRWMLDLKTARGIYGENAMQVDAYRHGEFYVDDDDPDTEHPMPEGIERLGAVHIQDGMTQLVPLDSTRAPFRVFLHAAYLARKTDTVNGFVGEPISTPALGATA